MTIEELEAYFAKYNNFVMKIVVKRTGDYQLAEEICLQSFYSLYQNGYRIEPDMVKAWLMRCTEHAIIDYYRTHHSQETLPEDDEFDRKEDAFMVEDTVEAYIQRCHHREILRTIFAAVKKKNESWYELLVLRCLMGLPYRTIEKQLSIPEKDLRLKMHRIRQCIRKEFGDIHCFD